MRCQLTTRTWHLYDFLDKNWFFYLFYLLDKDGLLDLFDDLDLFLDENGDLFDDLAELDGRGWGLGGVGEEVG